jgi:hypothetical protein
MLENFIIYSRCICAFIDFHLRLAFICVLKVQSIVALQIPLSYFFIVNISELYFEQFISQENKLRG